MVAVIYNNDDNDNSAKRKLQTIVNVGLSLTIGIWHFCYSYYY